MQPRAASISTNGNFSSSFIKPVFERIEKFENGLDKVRYLCSSEVESSKSKFEKMIQTKSENFNDVYVFAINFGFSMLIMYNTIIVLLKNLIRKAIYERKSVLGFYSNYENQSIFILDDQTKIKRSALLNRDKKYNELIDNYLNNLNLTITKEGSIYVKPYNVRESRNKGTNTDQHLYENITIVMKSWTEMPLSPSIILAGYVSESFYAKTNNWPEIMYFFEEIKEENNDKSNRNEISSPFTWNTKEKIMDPEIDLPSSDRVQDFNRMVNTSWPINWNSDLRSLNRRDEIKKPCMKPLEHSAESYVKMFDIHSFNVPFKNSWNLSPEFFSEIEDIEIHSSHKQKNLENLEKKTISSTDPKHECKNDIKDPLIPEQNIPPLEDFRSKSMEILNTKIISLKSSKVKKKKSRSLVLPSIKSQNISLVPLSKPPPHFNYFKKHDQKEKLFQIKSKRILKKRPIIVDKNSRILEEPLKFFSSETLKENAKIESFDISKRLIIPDYSAPKIAPISNKPLGKSYKFDKDALISMFRIFNNVKEIDMKKIYFSKIVKTVSHLIGTPIKGLWNIDLDQMKTIIESKSSNKLNEVVLKYIQQVLKELYLHEFYSYLKELIILTRYLDSITSYFCFIYIDYCSEKSSVKKKLIRQLISFLQGGENKLPNLMHTKSFSIYNYFQKILFSIFV